MDKNFFNLNYEQSSTETYKRQKLFDYLKITVVLLFVIISGLVYIFFPSNEEIKINIAENPLDTTVYETTSIWPTARDNTNSASATNSSNETSVSSISNETKENKTNSTEKDTSWKDIILVNINTAPSKELERINGIGPSLAKNIIDYRTKSGGFAHKEEIKNVKGIGAKLYEKIKDYIVVD
jgi:comEA protein